VVSDKVGSMDLRIGNFRLNRISNRIGVIDRLHVQCRLSWGGCVCALATAVQLHVKWSCKHKSQLQTVQRLMFLLNSDWAEFVVWRHTACAADSKFSNSNRDVRFEFESNLEASQVSSWKTPRWAWGKQVHGMWYISLQCFDTVGWRQEGHLACKRNWMLVCWWWWFDWSFARLIAPVVQLSPPPPSSFASINTGKSRFTWRLESGR